MSKYGGSEVKYIFIHIESERNLNQGTVFTYKYRSQIHFQNYNQVTCCMFGYLNLTNIVDINIKKINFCLTKAHCCISCSIESTLLRQSESLL